MKKVRGLLPGHFHNNRVMAALLVALLLTPSLSAYEVPLSVASLHEAFVLGQRNDHLTAEFLTPYLK